MVKPRQGGAWRTRGGRLYFAASRGVVSLHPDRARTNPLPPPVVIEKVLVDGRAVPADRPAALPPGAGALEIRYAGLSFQQPRKNRYRHRLEGLDAAWVEAGTRRAAVYVNLAPGTYRFRVQASNNDGVWNEAGAAFAFTLAPRFYQTRWFLGLCAAAALAAAFGLYRARLRALNRQYLAVLEERGRLARELHDTLMQGMTAVWAQVGGIRDRLPPPADAVRSELREVQDLVARSLEETRHFVSDLREQARQEGDLGRALSMLARRLASAGDAACAVEVTGSVYHLPDHVQNELFRIGQEALANALKHARARRIVLRLDYRKDAVSLTVTDDGQGFEPQAAAGPAHGHFGLVGLGERAERIGAALRIDSRPGGGTRVSALWLRDAEGGTPA